MQRAPFPFPWVHEVSYSTDGVSSEVMTPSLTMFSSLVLTWGCMSMWHLWHAWITECKSGFSCMAWVPWNLLMSAKQSGYSCWRSLVDFMDCAWRCGKHSAGCVIVSYSAGGVCVVIQIAWFTCSTSSFSHFGRPICAYSIGAVGTVWMSFHNIPQVSIFEYVGPIVYSELEHWWLESQSACHQGWYILGRSGSQVIERTHCLLPLCHPSNTVNLPFVSLYRSTRVYVPCWEWAWTSSM